MITISEQLIATTIPKYVTETATEVYKCYLQDEFKTTITTANSNMKVLEDRAIALLKNNICTDNFIKITHKIWLTNIDNPYEPNSTTLDLVKNQYNNLPTFKHIFWTNNTEYCKHFITNLELSNIDIEVKDINEFKSYKGWNILLALLHQKLFAQASDIARIMIICKYGGFYSDMGFSLKPAITILVNQFDIAANGEIYDPGIVSHNFLFSRSTNHMLFETCLNNILDINILKKYYWRVQNITGIIELFGPMMLTAIVSSLCINDNILLVVNNNYTFDRYHNNSWFGATKYGCSRLDTIDTKQFERELSL